MGKGKQDPAEGMQSALEAMVAAVQPLLGDEIDLALFGGELGDFDLKIPDVHGNTHVYAIPSDIPFEMGFRFMRAHQGLARATVALANAKSDAAEDAAATKVIKAFEQTRLAFLEILKIRSAAVTVEDLHEIGHSMLEHTWGVLVMRLNIARLQSGEQRALVQAGEPIPKGTGRRARQKKRKAAPRAS